MSASAQQMKNMLRAHKRAGALRVRKPVKWMHPYTVEREYTSDLLSIVRDVRRVAQENMTQLVATVRTEQAMLPRADGERMDDELTIRVFTQRLRDEFAKHDIRGVAAKNMGKTAAYNKTQYHRVVKSAISVDVFQAEPWLAGVMDSAVAGNVALITKMDNTTIGEIGEIIARAGRGGLRSEDLAATIMDRFDVEESRAALIARDQVSKFNGELTSLRQQSLGVTKYTWRTSLDDRVRETHAEKEGQVYEWADPPSDTGNPGEDIQCRCYGEPDFTDLLEGL